MWFCCCCCVPSWVFLYNHHSCARKRQHMTSQWSKLTTLGHLQSASHPHMRQACSLRGKKWYHKKCWRSSSPQELMENSAGAIDLAEIENKQENPIRWGSSRFSLCWQDCCPTGSSYTAVETESWYLLSRAQSSNTYPLRMLLSSLSWILPSLVTALPLFSEHSP